MFLAYLSVVPSLAAFMLSVETRFFEEYTRFYGDIQRHVAYSKIESNHRDLVQSFLDGALNFVVLQGSVCIVGILVAPQFLDWFGISFAQLAIFRLGLLATVFHSGFQMILLAYFDARQAVLALAGLFLATNGLLTLVTLKLGFRFYGYGYFLSALIAFAAAFMATDHYIRRLPYQTFVRNNASVVS